jgi:hypothetical protein
MLLNTDLIDLEIDTLPFLKESALSILSVDWSQDEFNRNEVTLKDGRLCLLPYLISKPEQLVPSQSKSILINSVTPLINLILERMQGYKIVRGELVNLIAGKSLVEHIDIYWFHKESRRIHIPITTNEHSKLTFEGRPHHLSVGNVYEINNRILHSGYNNGTSDRIHLILDMMPIDVFNNAVVSKQNFMEKV